MTDDQETCPCQTTPWPRLITVIEEREYTVRPTLAHSPASALPRPLSGVQHSLYTPLEAGSPNPR